ncbi:MAG: metallophosphoesterase, partial [Nocardioidaceae bacterium]|nr:metallophosphoesterase [Nocardioidaceae bacterium]
MTPAVRTFLKTLLVVAIALAVAVPTAYTTFVHSERTVVIGAHTATVRPTFDGFATLDFGSVLPRLRVPSSQGSIGVAIDVGDSEVGGLNDLIAQDAVIASQPKGEIAKVEATVRSMAYDALLRGVGMALLVGLVTVAGWRVVGARRRAAVWARVRKPTRKGVGAGVTAGVVVVVGLGLVYWPEHSSRDTDVEAEPWVSIYTLFPETPKSDILDTVQVSDGGAAQGGSAIVRGAIETYQNSVTFYGKMRDKAKLVTLRQPEEGEVTAVVVTDRHDNIGMDPVVKAVADVAGATMMFDLGDDTSTGGAWEGFSINSLAKEFRDRKVVAVAGNHDTGPSVVKSMKKHGFTVLEGKPVDVEGIRFLGASDPRSSGLTAGYQGELSDSNKAIAQEDADLTDVACADGEISTVLVHSPASAKKLAASGCVSLILSGHLHRQVGPNVILGANG